MKGGVIGSFRVTRLETIAGFHLRFTEEGESSFCAGGEEGEEGEEKSGTIKFAPGASAPIIHANGEWLVATDTRSIGGGSLQGAEVPLVGSPYGNSSSGLIYLTWRRARDCAAATSSGTNRSVASPSWSSLDKAEQRGAGLRSPCASSP